MMRFFFLAVLKIVVFLHREFTTGRCTNKTTKQFSLTIKNSTKHV